MIKGINSSGRYVQVNGGSPSTNYISPGAVGAGQMRYNPNTNNIEVNDGNMWQTLGTGFATVELTPDTESLLEWARKKRSEELEYERLAQDNQAVKIAMENVERAKQQLTITAKLARDSYHDHGEVMEQASP